MPRRSSNQSVALHHHRSTPLSTHSDYVVSFCFISLVLLSLASSVHRFFSLAPRLTPPFQHCLSSPRSSLQTYTVCTNTPSVLNNKKQQRKKNSRPQIPSNRPTTAQRNGHTVILHGFFSLLHSLIFRTCPDSPFPSPHLRSAFCSSPSSSFHNVGVCSIYSHLARRQSRGNPSLSRPWTPASFDRHLLPTYMPL